MVILKLWAFKNPVLHPLKFDVKNKATRPVAANTSWISYITYYIYVILHICSGFDLLYNLNDAVY